MALITVKLLSNVTVHMSTIKVTFNLVDIAV
jgi:hypothetical protein